MLDDVAFADQDVQLGEAQVANRLGHGDLVIANIGQSRKHRVAGRIAPGSIVELWPNFPVQLANRLHQFVDLV